MEWKPIKLEDIQLKPVYEISENGDVRRSDNGKVFTGGERIMLTLADGTYKHFFRRGLVNAIFHDDEMWRPIKLNNVEIKPIYEITRHGDIRKSNTCRVFTGSKKVVLTLVDGTHKQFSRNKLVEAVFTEHDKSQKDLPHELDQLSKQLNLLFDHTYSAYDIHISRSIWDDNMIIIQQDALSSPISVSLESNGSRVMYIIRCGPHYNDTRYYGTGRDHSRTYFEFDDACEVVYHIDRLLHNKLIKYRSWRRVV